MRLPSGTVRLRGLMAYRALSAAEPGRAFRRIVPSRLPANLSQLNVLLP